MSEGSGENPDGSKVCRDFQRGVCRRTQCKFRHDLSNCPPETSRVMFCHDFQNRTCTRINCKFLHYSVADEVYYRQNGRFPHPVEDKMRERDNGGPACKDYILGTCRRGLDCKYRHISYTQFQEENGHLDNCDDPTIQNTRSRNEFYNCSRSPTPINQNAGPTNVARMNGFAVNSNNVSSDNSSLTLWNGNVTSDTNNRVSYASYNTVGSNPDAVMYQRNDANIVYDSRLANSRLENNEYSLVSTNGYDTYEPPVKRRFYEIKNNSFYNRPPMLEEQNAMLRKELEDLRKQVSDLTATNEFLLEQNAQLRMRGPRPTRCDVTAVTVPAVTITNTAVPPTTQPQPQVIRTVTASVATVPVSIAAVSMAPVQVAAPIVSMATPQTQIIANSTPIAIANNSQQLALAQQSLAGPANGANQIITSSTQQQILATNTQLTISNAQPPTQQILTPIGGPGQQLSMSNASQPIISYPIMTQSILPH